MTEPSLQFFVDLESKVWDALVSGDADADQSLLADDFVGVYSTGFADRTEHAAQLVNGPTVVAYTITEARLIHLSATAVLLCYRADCFRRLPGDLPGDVEGVYISSLWIERDGRWLNLFSQDTPAT